MLGITIIAKSETVFIAAGPKMKPEKLAGLVIPMGIGKKTIEENLN